MVSFRSKWLDFSPQTPGNRAAKTDKTGSVSLVSGTVEHSGKKLGSSTTENHSLLLDYDGVPKVQVEIAEIANDVRGVTDPVRRKLAVLRHLRDYYREAGDVDMTAKVRRNGGWTATNMFKFVQDLQRLGKVGARLEDVACGRWPDAIGQACAEQIEGAWTLIV